MHIVLILETVNFKTKNITRDKKGHFMIATINEEEYNNSKFEYVKTDSNT